MACRLVDDLHHPEVRRCLVRWSNFNVVYSVRDGRSIIRIINLDRVG